MEGQNMPGLIDIFESSLRSVIISCGLQFMTFQCVDMAVFRQKKRWPAYLYMLFKTFVMSASLMIAENRPEFLVPNMIIQVVCTIGVLLAFVWTWSDDPLHVILIMTISEILITFPALCVPVLVNLLEGRAASDIAGHIHPLDFLIPLLVIGLFYCVRPICRVVMQFLGRLYLPYRKLLWVAVCLYYLYANLPAFIGKDGTLASAGEMEVLLIALISALFMLIFICLLFRFIRREDQEKRFMDIQVGLIRKRADMTSRIRGEVEESSRIISQQMEELQRRVEEGEEIDQELIGEYTASLETVRTRAYRGVFCKDVLVDEILCEIREEAQLNGMQAEISLSGYDRGNIAEEDLVRILYCLGNAAVQDIQENKDADGDSGTLSLTMTTSGERLFIRICAPVFILSRERAAYVRRLARNYRGGVTVTARRDFREKDERRLLAGDGSGKRGKEILVNLRCTG